ncbi:MAG: hypothetical protein J5588_07695 [Bacteroidales bacterium]|nr:hypothetical protein [Bacteroidales bacterium]
MNNISNITIKTYNGSRNPSAVYVLSRGNNSGKLLDAPCPNCYEITAPSVDIKHIRAAVHILFCSGLLRQYLHGSVIEFVRLEQYRKVFAELWNKISPEVMEQTAKMLAGIDTCQADTIKKLKMLKEMRYIIARTATKQKAL